MGSIMQAYQPKANKSCDFVKRVQVTFVLVANVGFVSQNRKRTQRIFILILCKEQKCHSSKLVFIQHTKTVGKNTTLSWAEKIKIIVFHHHKCKRRFKEEKLMYFQNYCNYLISCSLSKKIWQYCMSKKPTYSYFIIIFSSIVCITILDPLRNLDSCLASRSIVL